MENVQKGKSQVPMITLDEVKDEAEAESCRRSFKDDQQFRSSLDGTIRPTLKDDPDTTHTQSSKRDSLRPDMRILSRSSAIGKYEGDTKEKTEDLNELKHIEDPLQFKQHSHYSCSERHRQVIEPSN